MTIERRLHHAARELREIRIAVPPLGGDIPSTSRTPAAVRRSRLPALAAPVLFLAGGLLAVGVTQREAAEPIRSDIPVAPAVMDAGPIPTEDADTGISATSASAELRMIAEFVDRNQRPASPASPASLDDETTIGLIAGGPS